MAKMQRANLCRAIGSLIVTVPSVWYLAQPQIERLSGKRGSHAEHGHEGEEHGEHGEESEGGDEGSEENSEKGGVESDAENESGEDAQVKEDPKEDNEKADSDSSDSEEGQQDTPDTSDDESSANVPHEKEGGQNVEGVRFKGATSGGTKEGEQGDTRKHIPDAKGGNKLRIESHYGNKQGEATTSEQSPDNEDLVRLTGRISYVIMLSCSEALTRACRLLHQSHLGVLDSNQENSQDCRTQIRSIQRTLQTTPRRVRSLVVGQKPRKNKAQWTLEDPGFVPFIVASSVSVSETLADSVL